MFDIGWTEMLVVGIIAILFVGPKELPGMLRTFGQVIKKVRSMAGEFQGQFNDALKEAELDGIKDTINDVRSLDPTKSIKDKLNPLKQELEKPVEMEPKKTKTPQEIEAEIAENYRKAQESAKKASSGPNAVPGFDTVPEPEVEVSKAASNQPASKKSAPKKPAANKTALKKTAAKKTTSSKAKKPAAKKPSKKSA